MTVAVCVHVSPNASVRHSVNVRHSQPRWQDAICALKNGAANATPSEEPTVLLRLFRSC